MTFPRSQRLARAFSSTKDRKYHTDTIDRDGTLGEYEAVVVLIVMTDRLAAGDHDHGRNVPTRYADYLTSGLNAKIDAVDSGPIELVISPE